LLTFGVNPIFSPVEMNERNVIHVRARGGDWEAYECDAVGPRFRTKKQAIDYAEHRARLSVGMRVVVDEKEPSQATAR